MASLTKYTPSLGKNMQFMQPKKPNLLRQLYEIYKRRAEFIRAERKLKALDDRLLADIGLLRDDIHDVIWHKKNKTQNMRDRN